MTTFASLGLAEPLLKALANEGYTTPTPIQEQSIPHLLEGRDLLGLAQTGTGKTASFALPILQRLDQIKQRPRPRSTRVLVLTPTRELAVQVGQSFRTYGSHYRLKHALVFGGVGMMPQVKAMAGGVDILVATPGRLLDLMGQDAARLDSVEVLVLDEADRMLDMGFIQPIRKIVAACPKARQTVLFSATMPDSISGLAESVLHLPVRVEVTPPATTVERIDQKVLFVDRANKRTLLAELLSEAAVERALVFTRTKHGANRVAEILEQSGISSDAIHGNKSQNARQKALADFRDGRIKALVATDIAARGIDVDGITHVINFELPNEPESYVHRIGRTARAGANGIALSLCDAEEVAYLRTIEKTIRQPVPVDEDHAWHAPHIASRGKGGKPQGQQSRPHSGQGKPQPQQPARAQQARPQGPQGRTQAQQQARPQGQQPGQPGKPQGQQARPHGPEGRNPKARPQQGRGNNAHGVHGGGQKPQGRPKAASGAGGQGNFRGLPGGGRG